MPTFYYRSTLTSCRKARSFLQSLNVPFEERDTARRPLSADELSALVGDREITPFLSTRNELYRERDMKSHPSSREEAIRLMTAIPASILGLADRGVLATGRPADVFLFDPERIDVGTCRRQEDPVLGVPRFRGVPARARRASRESSARRLTPTGASARRIPGLAR